MKKISIFILSILILGCISIGCSKDFPSRESLINIYYENKELLNSIKDDFFSSDYIPTNGSQIILYYDYKNKQLFCDDDARGEKLQSIQNVHSDAIEYFKHINKNYAWISFRNLKLSNADDIIIEFSLGSSYNYVAIILYTSNPDSWPKSWLVNIEDNWYTCRYIASW